MALSRFGSKEMGKNRFSKYLSVVLTTVLIGPFCTLASADGAPRISPDELKSMLGNSDVVVVDVRTADTWKTSKTKIRGAVKEDPEDVESWADNYPKYLTLVLY
jgi:hypothetical protein